MKHSAGLLIYRRKEGKPEVLLVHPGGPFWLNKDQGAWSLPKGEFIPGEEEPLAAARRETAEETGCRPGGPFTELKPITQRGGKVVHAWAVEGDCDPTKHKCNTFDLEWPPGSGRMRTFPEVDKAQWFTLPEARRKINKAQAELLDELEGLFNQSR